MMFIQNTEKRYGAMTIALHWVMALLMIALIISGLYMTRMSFSAFQLKLFRWHKEFGMLVLMLAFFRLGWRLTNITPTLSTLAWWERVGARTAHGLFYVLMFLIPISGWLLSSSAGISISFFGWFVFPDFISADENSRLFYTGAHKWLSYFFIALLCGHTGAALKHYFYDKDDILQRMLKP